MDFGATTHTFIAGLPWTAWLLWVTALGLGLTTELIFYFRQWRSRGRGEQQSQRPDRGD